MRRVFVVGLVVTLCVLAAMSASAGVWFQEDFNGTAGDDISTLGWTAGSNIKVSSTVVDSGNCAVSGADDAWLRYEKAVPIGTIGANDWFELTFASNVEAMGGPQEDVILSMIEQNDIVHRFVLETDNNGFYVGTSVYTRDLSNWIEWDHKTYAYAGQKNFRGKLVVSKTGTFSYVSFDGGGWIANDSLSGPNSGYTAPINAVQLTMYNVAGTAPVNVDTIVVAAVPEPATLAGLAAGLTGLLAFSRRRKRA